MTNSGLPPAPGQLRGQPGPGARPSTSVASWTAPSWSSGVSTSRAAPRSSKSTTARTTDGSRGPLGTDTSSARGTWTSCWLIARRGSQRQRIGPLQVPRRRARPNREAASPSASTTVLVIIQPAPAANSPGPAIAASSRLRASNGGRLTARPPTSAARAQTPRSARNGRSRSISLATAPQDPDPRSGRKSSLPLGVGTSRSLLRPPRSPRASPPNAAHDAAGGHRPRRLDR